MLEEFNIFLHLAQWIIQKKSVSGSRTLPFAIFDQEVSLFPNSSVILRYLLLKLRQKCSFLKILDTALKF